jgi:Mannosyltransferase putative
MNYVSPEDSVHSMMEAVKTLPPGPWPAGWASWHNTCEAMRRLADEFLSSLPPPRTAYRIDRGIVIAGGGLKYFPSVWVNVRLLRHLGCTLPIQLWYLGEGEIDPYLKRLLAPHGVECVDARKFEKETPCRILCGWELKPYAALHAPYREVLFLDADNGVVRDPTYLFDEPAYKRHGSVFWPDYACWKLKPDVWRTFGMLDMAEPDVAIHERAFESGQYLIDKSRCERELRLALWYAEHSDWTFKHVYGDKECFHLAWRKIGTEYAMPTAGPGWIVHTIVQFDFAGQIVFQHRCQDKWRFAGNRRVESLANEDMCFQFVDELSTQWDGVLWHNPRPTTREQCVIDSLHGRRFLYRRVGYDERILELAANNSITKGAEECERRWDVNEVGGQMRLTISRLDRPTCHLHRDADGVWRGAWLEHERMPIDLVPLEA